MKKDISKFVGNRIREVRKERRITQKVLGEKIGVKHNTISSYENGTNEPEQEILYKIADVLDVSINDFFPYDDKLILSDTRYPFYPHSISAGLPFIADGTTELNTVTIPDEIMGKYAGHDDIIISKINGDSMDKLMNDGSFIAIKPVNNTDELNDGDIVVFSNEYEYSVKYLYQTDDKLIFKPYSHNKCHHEQHYDKDDNIQIHGKVITYIVNLD